MVDITVERKETLSRQEAATWLTELARAFDRGGNVQLPVGPGTVGLHLPERVDAELEIEVEGDEVQIEIEFTWPVAHADDEDEDSDEDEDEA